MKKSVLIAIIATVVVLVTVVCICCIWLKKEEPIDVQVQNALNDVLNDAMPEDEEPDEILAETESRSGYEVLSYTETEIGVLVTFLVYAPDLYTVAKEIDENYEFETEEELKAAVIDAIGKAQLIEQEMTIEFIKTDDGYEPILTMEFIDAYYGGVLKLLDEALDKMNEEVAQ